MALAGLILCAVPSSRDLEENEKKSMSSAILMISGIGTLPGTEKTSRLIGRVNESNA